jgi:hypothetical protein
LRKSPPGSRTTAGAKQDSALALVLLRQTPELAATQGGFGR